MSLVKSRFNAFYILLATVKVRIMKTRYEETKEYLKYCQEKLRTVPEKHHAFLEREIKRCKKFLYGS